MSGMTFTNTKAKYEKPTSGCGPVRLGKSSFSVELTYKSGTNKKTNEPEFETETFKFDNDELDRLVKIGAIPEDFELKNGKKYFMSVKGETEILQLRPADGFFQDVKLAGFAHARDKDGDETNEILIIEGEFKDKKNWQIVANIEVVSGPNAGVVYPIYLPLAGTSDSGNTYYRFYFDDGKLVIATSAKSGERMKRFEELAILSGLTEYKFGFENDEEFGVQDVLKGMDKAARKLKKTFSMLVKNGYPDSFTEGDGEESEVDEDVVEEKPTKKKVVVDDEDEKPVKKEVVTKKKSKWEDDDEEE